MRAISLLQPQKLVFGEEALKQFTEDTLASDRKKVWILIAEPLVAALEESVETIKKAGIAVELVIYEEGEPTFSLYEEYLEKARVFGAESVVGIGGGSVLDLAKIIAAMQDCDQQLDNFVGLNLLPVRKIHMVCIPTTSGTGSEVSPNAILLDEGTLEKKGIISPFLVPDATYIDPLLTLNLPPKITAETGIDALSHCIEAFTNKFSHPLVDDYALRGIRLIGRNLHKAYENGQDLDARSAVALGSMYGGLCLGPVNTAAVHALSYPLGGKYHVPHGLANAVLLPEVMSYNMNSDLEKHAQIAIAMGAEEGASLRETAQNGVEKVRELVSLCNIPQNLTELGVQKEDVGELTGLAMKVTRLLKNNPKELTVQDAENIYCRLF
ncbi:iron-containing alcohol dehydrogenase [Echinicola jeungdonensis]|uniref:Iron-containing alcohol dehydrogenase n=1 Tax=Echinicola jeungdonensis TaxID=709343 RepID=A0ABV5J3R3_9BACT|nr:iron-containing alcohol dehydrogenase [Echinicola jeungdonensis]MDN3669362.1 iron-containing alcohol dehydrogenase [Echinicola jeungdonensis]